MKPLGRPLALICILLAACSSTLPTNKKPESYALEYQNGNKWSQRLIALGDPGDGRSGVRLLPDGQDALASRLLLAKQAERSIDAQYYLVHDDPAGHLFATSLLRAADRGVRVRLLVDDMDTASYDAMTAALDLHPQIEIRLFNPFSRQKGKFLSGITELGRINRRMHNKSMTIDNSVTIVGGRNIGAEYFLGQQEMNYSDLDLLAAGPVVRDVSASFDEYWNSPYAVPARDVIGDPTGFDLSSAREQLNALFDVAAASAFGTALKQSVQDTVALRNEQLDWVSASLYADPASKAAGDDIGGPVLASQIAPLFAKADNNVVIVSAYFVPRNEGTAWLTELEERGVDVRIVTNSIASNDVAPVYAHYAKKRKELLRAGVELYELRPDNYKARDTNSFWGQSRSGLHTKAFAIDDRMLFVGSFNWDPRSVNINTEMGILIESRSVTEGVIRRLNSALPEYTYKLSLTENDRINWTTRRNDGATLLYRSEPVGTTRQHLWAGILGILPIGNQL